jgi:hypothetical protein
MSPSRTLPSDKSRLAVLLEHFGTVEDPRDVRRILHPLSEVKDYTRDTNLSRLPLASRGKHRKA